MSDSIDNTGLGNFIDPVGIQRGALDIVTGKEANAAQGRIAEAQLEEQRRTRAAAVAAANPSPQEIQQLNQAISLNQQDITRKQRLIDSSDPALIEAGTQALKLLQGQDAKTLDPIRKQREKERLQLTNKLRSQIGSGFENSTAGIQALSAFDEATANALGNAQQNSLSQLLGIAQNTSAGYGVQNNISNSGTLSALFGNQGNRMISAINGTPITGSGAQFVTDLQNARSNTALANAGVNAGLAYVTGGASAAAPKATAGAPTSRSSYLGSNYSDFGY